MYQGAPRDTGKDQPNIYAIEKHFVKNHPRVDRSLPNLFEVTIIDRSRPTNLARYIADGLLIEEKTKGGQ